MTGDARVVVVERLLERLAHCPAESLRWAALGWALAHAERDFDRARQLEADGREALALARPVLARPTFAELQQRRGVA